MLFTHEALSELPATGKRYTVRDDRVKGLTAKVLSSGYTTLWHERVIKRKKVRTRLGVMPNINVDALRARCVELNAPLAKVPPAKGKKAREALQEATGAVGTHAKNFLSTQCRQLAPKTIEQYTPLLGEIVLHYPEFSDMTARNVRLRMDKMAHTPVKANRYLAVCSVFFRWLFEKGELEYNPALGIRRYKEKPKVTKLNEAEIAKLAVQLNVSHANPDVILAIRLLLVTGCRVNEVCGIQMNELDAEANTLTIKSGRVKSGREFLTFIPEGYMPIKQLSCGDGAVRQALKRMCVAAGITVVTPHDLRRTVGTLLAKAKYKHDLRQRYLNHAATGVTDRHYNVHDYSDEKREMASFMEDKMRELGVLSKKRPLVEQRA